MNRKWSRFTRLGLLAAVAASVLGVAAAGRAAPKRPSPASQQRLEAAELQLQEAQRVLRANPGKEGELYLQRALGLYNAAREAAFGRPQFDIQSGRGSFDATISELEPNGSAAAANSLDAVILREGAAVAVGEIRPIGDQDFYSFFAPAGARVWAYVDTGGPLNSGDSSTDSVLALIGADGSTVIEEDDDDGTGNGCDATIETGLASVIAGRRLDASGTYFLSVKRFNDSSILSPYRLYVVLSATADVNETEPNETIDTANTLAPIGGRVGVATGAAAGADVDIYRLALQAGDVAAIQLDKDPARDGSSGEELGLLDPNGAVILAVGSGAPSAGGGEGFCFRAPSSGVYFVRVLPNAASADTDYRLMASVCTRPVQPNAPAVINGVLGSGSGDYPAISGKQVGRMTRNGVASNGLFPKPFPGFQAITGLRAFDAYVLQNRTAIEAPVTVQVASSTGISLFSAAYSLFDPGNVASGYVGDAGSSANLPIVASYSFRVAPGEVFVVVVHEVDVASAVGTPYTLGVSGDFRAFLVGCPTNLTVPNDPNQAGAVVNYNTPGVSDASVGPVACSPVSGSFFPIGGTVVTCQDRAGNTCSFQVTVQDTQPPVVACPRPITVNQTQANGAVVNYMASATDNTPGVSLVCSPDSGSVFPLGLTVVDCIATDAAGNTTTCTFPVTVKDTEGPVVTCPSSVSADQDQAGGAVVSYMVAATDNGGSVNVTCSPDSGAFFPLGTTTVTCVAADSSGNVSTCSFPVTVSAPASAAGVKVTASGTLATGTPPAKFKVTASVAATGAPKLVFTHTQTTAGQLLKSASVSAITRTGNLVRIFGALRNGRTGPLQQFMLEVRDVAKPGANQDTYRLDILGGFQLAQTVIKTGEITIKP